MTSRHPNGPFFDVLALFLLLALAALLHLTTGASLWGLAHAPFLPAIATYYALLRPLPLAIPAALLAGAWADGLGSVPYPCFLFSALAVLAFSALYGRSVLNRTPLSCTLLGTASALLTAILQAIAAASASTAPLSTQSILLHITAQTFLAIPTVFATTWAALAFERAVGNIVPDDKKGAAFHART